MRKITTTLLAAVWLLVSCGGQAGTNSNQDKEPATAAINLTKADFLSKVANYESNPSEWKYLGDRPAVIDFYASWCGPCKMLAPILEEMAVEYGDSIYVYKIDTEQEQELAAVFGIRYLPTLLFVPMDGVPQRADGLMREEAIREVIDVVLLNKPSATKE